MNWQGHKGLGRVELLFIVFVKNRRTDVKVNSKLYGHFRSPLHPCSFKKQSYFIARLVRMSDRVSDTLGIIVDLGSTDFDKTVYKYSINNYIFSLSTRDECILQSY